MYYIATQTWLRHSWSHYCGSICNLMSSLVLSSDRPASEIANLEQRLVSRFEWGLTAELQPPDIETRMAILKKKSQALHVQLAQEVLEFLAQRVRSHVRRLECALMRVASFLSIS